MADDPEQTDAHDKAAADMAGDGRKSVEGFDLLNSVARGNSTEVWEALERATQQTRAVKLLSSTAFKEREQVNILKHEAKVGGALNHPSVIRVDGFKKSKTHAFLVMDYFPHPNLKKAYKADEAGTLSLAKKIVEGVCQGLGHMHEKGWLHLDVKPENLLVAPDGDVRVIDFSLSAKPKGGLGALFGGKSEIRGTRTYIAPETLLKKPATQLTDVYSLGVTLFELLTGRPPFSGSDGNALLRAHVKESVPPASGFNENLTDECDKFLSRMLAKKPDTRHQSMTEVYAEFRGLNLFKEDPVARREALRKKREEDSLDAASRLDSRADAVRTSKGIKPPPKPEPKKKRRRRDDPRDKQPETPPTAPPQPAPPQFQPQYPPQYAPAMGQFPPGQPMPYGGPPPGQMPPGYPPQQYPQGQFPQGQPPQGQPQQGPPPQGQPGQFPPPQGRPAPPPGGPPQTPPQAGPPAAGGPVQVPGLTRPEKNKHASQQQVAEDDDIPLMTELPDIM